MTSMYHVPSQILADQAMKIAAHYRQDSERNRGLLEGIGITSDVIAGLSRMGMELQRLDAGGNETMDVDSKGAQESTHALQVLLDWRNRKVMPRVKIAMRGDTGLRHFRPGKLCSTRPATILREMALLIATMERYQYEPRFQRRGLGATLVAEGRALLATAQEEIRNPDLQKTELLDDAVLIYELEEAIDNILSDIENCVAVVFQGNAAAIRRYRMNVIREYVAHNHDLANVDDTASIDQPDPLKRLTAISA